MLGKIKRKLRINLVNLVTELPKMQKQSRKIEKKMLRPRKKQKKLLMI